MNTNSVFGFRMKQFCAPWAALLLMGAASAQPVADAQVAPAAPPEFATNGRVDLGVSGANLTSGESSWFDQYARGHVTVRPGTTINWGLSHERHFDERGTVGALSVTQDINADWYAMGGMSFGSASFQAKRRFDVGIYRKWGEDRRWVTGLAYMNSHSNDDIHRDRGLTTSVAYYSPDAWVAEGGLVFNRSNPGSVKGTRGFAAVTLGQEKQHYLVLKLDHGKEAYLPEAAIQGPSQANVAFNSTEATVQWRQWLSPKYGYTVGVQHYRNPYYRRNNLSVGMFFDF